jgi:Uma2 family endonuclease
MQVIQINKLGSQSTQLSPISWRTYESLLDDLGDKYNERIAYDGETLEIMSASYLHCLYSSNVNHFIFKLCCEADMNFRAFGTFTLKQMKTGIEPDQCYYIQNEPKIRQKLLIDLNQDPPPDLAVEIDISTDSTKKLDIYASIGVPELWFFDGDELVIYQLK